MTRFTLLFWIGTAIAAGWPFSRSAIATTCRDTCWEIKDGKGSYAAEGASLDFSDGRMTVMPCADKVVLAYVFHPGARPQAEASQIELVTKPAFGGVVRADMKRIGKPGTKSVVAKCVGEKHVFDLQLPGNEPWQLTRLVFSAAEVDDRRPFSVESVSWLSESTPAGAFRLLPKRRADGLPLFFPEGGDEPGFVIENTADGVQRWSVCMAFTNRQGRAFSRTERLSLAPRGQYRLDVPELRSCRGLWQAEATVYAEDGSTAHRSARIGVLDLNPVSPRLRSGKFRIGVNFHMGRYSGIQETRALDAVNALGAKLVRGGAFVFSSFQPKGPDDWRTEADDRRMGRLKDRGIDVDAIISFAPKWSWDARHAQLAKDKNWTYGAYSRPIPGAFGQFAEKLARHYGTDIAYYELGNEWDCISPEILTIDDGVALLKEVYAGLKRGNRDAVLTTCGFAYGSSEDAPSMSQTNMHERITAEASGFYDVHAVHAHSHEPHFSKRLGDFLRMRQRLGDSTPWYLNEAGISSFHGNEDVAAEYVWKKVLYAWARGSRDYIWYTLRATGWDPKDFEQGFGLMTPDWNVRPAFMSFAALTHLLSGADCDGILCDGDLQVYRFRDASGNVVLAGWSWNDAGTYQLSLDGVKGAFRVDLMGNRHPIASETSRWALDFGPVPCAYLFHADTRN